METGTASSHLRISQIGKLGTYHARLAQQSTLDIMIFLRDIQIQNSGFAKRE